MNTILITVNVDLPDSVSVGDLQSNLKRVVNNERRLTSSKPPTQYRHVACMHYTVVRHSTILCEREYG